MRSVGQDQGSPIAITQSGRLAGTIEDGLRVFRGIPYGQTGGKEGRWRAPLPPPSWQGERRANLFGPSAPQVRRGRPGKPPSVGGEPFDADQAEECLSLNIWTRSLSNSRRAPVMVWLHGGGFSVGSARSPVFTGHGLASAHDVVFVSINHRLGPLGFLYFEDADANVGLLDIVAALRWIRDNIASFGGDPDRVMIFGESGGGQKVCALMAMPTARGLFHSAAIQSGAALQMSNADKALEWRQGIAKLLHLKDGDLASFRCADADALVKAASEAAGQLRARAPGFPGGVQPVVDGKILPCHPFDDPAIDNSAHVPLIVGHNRTEATYFHLLGLGPNDTEMTSTEMRKRLDPILGPAAEKIYRAFAEQYPAATPWQSYVTILTEFPSGIFARTIAHRRQEAGCSPTYLYRFDWETHALGPIAQSPHMIEIPFVLNNAEVATGLVGSDTSTVELAGRVASAWAALARSGTPSGAGLGAWPAFSLENPQELHIDLMCSTATPPSGKLENLLLEAAGVAKNPGEPQ